MGPSWSKFLSEKTSNLFWKDVFKAWYCYLNQVTFKATELLTVPLWYNSLISTQKIFFPHWYQAGINMPLDIVKPDGRILSTMELRQTFGLRTNFLEYYSNERVLKRLLKQTSPNSYTRPVFSPYLRMLTSHKEGSKFFYETLNFQFKNEKLRDKWNNILDTTIKDNDWDKIDKICFKTIGRNDLIWLQLRIIQRILGTRAYLYKINIGISDSCRFCQSPMETIHHIFVCCPIVSDFWKTLQHWFKHLGLYLTIQPTTILFGNLEYEFSKNLIFLVAKKFIWTQLNKSKPLNLLDFKDCMKNIYNEQEYIAKLNDSLERFNVS